MHCHYRRKTCLFLCFAIALGLLRFSHATEDARPLVLVELFTSEGCSSCPPADKLLAEFYAKQPVGEVTIVPMAFHVDYWDRLGWKDPFGDAAYSRRQRAYAGLLKSDSVYTPQMIVNGRIGFVGSDRGAARNAIEGARKDAPVRIEVAPVLKEDEVVLTLTMQGELASDALLWAAVVEDALESEVTRGENRGKRLTHQAVVRSFQGETYVPATGGRDRVTLSLPLGGEWKLENCRVVVALESKESGALYALGQCALKSKD